MLQLLILAVAVSGAVAVKESHGIDLRPYNFTAAIFFTGNDLNNDSVLTRQEFDTVFTQYDFNHDNDIERHEYVCYISAKDEKLASLAHALYDVYDANHDHHLRVGDFDAFFTKMDTDGNGSVSDLEFVHHWTKLLEDTEHFSLHGNTHPIHHDNYCVEHFQITTPSQTTGAPMAATSAPPMTNTTS